MWLSCLEQGYSEQPLIFPFVFQLQVANLLSSVFKLLMTHKVRSCYGLLSTAGSSLGREKYWDCKGLMRRGTVTIISLCPGVPSCSGSTWLGTVCIQAEQGAVSSLVSRALLWPFKR